MGHVIDIHAEARMLSYELVIYGLDILLQNVDSEGWGTFEIQEELEQKMRIGFDVAWLILKGC